MQNLNSMKAKIAIGRKQLGLDEDTYRLMLAEVVGCTSTKNCTEAQLARVLGHLASKGAVFASAKPKASKKAYMAKSPAIRSDFYTIPDCQQHADLKRKICAMWAELGYDMTSLDTRCKRQCGVEMFLWAKDLRFLQCLAKDLHVRLARKCKKAKEAELTGVSFAN